MVRNDTPVFVNNPQVEKVQSYIYLYLPTYFITYRDRNTNIRVRENTKVTVRSRNWTWAREGTSAAYEITDGHSVSPLGSPMKGKDLEEDRRYDGETN